MKTIYLILAAFFTFMLFFAGCIVTIIDASPAGEVPSPTTFKIIAGAVLAVYELVVRIVPSVGDYSPISWIIKALKILSDTLNVKRSP